MFKVKHIRLNFPISLAQIVIKLIYPAAITIIVCLPSWTSSLESQLSVVVHHLSVCLAYPFSLAESTANVATCCAVQRQRPVAIADQLTVPSPPYTATIMAKLLSTCWPFAVPQLLLLLLLLLWSLFLSVCSFTVARNCLVLRLNAPINCRKQCAALPYQPGSSDTCALTR